MLTLHVTLHADGSRAVWWDSDCDSDSDSDCDSDSDYDSDSGYTNLRYQGKPRTSDYMKDGYRRRVCRNMNECETRGNTCGTHMCLWKVPCTAAVVAVVTWMCVGRPR